MTTAMNFSDHSPPDLEAGDATIEAFRWLLILGFPASVAAARLMPEVFSDALDEAIDVARRMTRNPFGRNF
jgi:hypothetical protein